MRFQQTCLLLCALVCLGTPRSATAQVVARIGDQAISLDEYEARATELRKTGYKHLQTMDMAAKRQLLDGIIAQDLLVLEGTRRGVGKDPVIAADLARHKRRALMNALYDAQALHGDYTSTEAQLRAYYHEKQYDVEVSSCHIVCATQADAQAVLDGLAAGTPFDSLLVKYTLPDVLPRFGSTGDVGWFRVGNLYPELKEPLATMPIGQVYPQAVKTDRGYHVFRLVDRRPVPFETSIDFVREKLRVQKRANDMEAYVNGLRKRYHIRVDAAGLERLAQIAPGVDSYAGKEILVAWDGGRLSVADYMGLVRAHRALHPSEVDADALRKSADNFAGQEVMMAEARRLGLDQLLEVRRQTEDRRRELFAKWLFQQEAAKRAQLDTSAASVRKFYEDNIDIYTRNDGQVTDFSVVAPSIRAAMLRQAQDTGMDRFLAELRQRYADQIHIDEAVLRRAFSHDLTPSTQD